MGKLVETATSILALVFCGFAFVLSADAQDLGALIQNAHFSPATVHAVISEQQSESLLNAFLYFDRGSRILQNYREPLPTRGAKGISIFQNVSPAVTLVITGNGENVDALGTGVVVESSGYVLTNWHVVAGHQDAVVFMKPPSGADVQKKYAYYAQVVYANPVPDLALLKLMELPASLPAVLIGDIAQAQIAEDIHIIGHPHGQLWSYSTGVLSQIRDDYSWKYEDGSQHHAKVLQMQTAINPGNSGGPVVDDSGHLIGLVAMSEEGQNLDYAIAADVIKSFLAQAKSTRVRGLKHDTASDQIAATFEASVAGTILYKSEYQNYEVYWILDTKGQTSSLLIKDKNGNNIEATRGTNTIGFSDWKAKLGNGDVIRASSKSELPEILWAEATPPLK